MWRLRRGTGPFLRRDEPVPRLDLNLVDLHSPRNMAAWTMSQLHLDPGLPARLARLAAFASRCGPIVHEAIGCALRGRRRLRRWPRDRSSRAGRRPTTSTSGTTGAARPSTGARRRSPARAQILHLTLAADLVRGLSDAEAAAAMVSQRTGTYFDPDVAEAYLDLADGLWPDGDEPVPLTDVLSCAPGTPVDELPGDRRLAVCEALADFADLKSARRGSHSHRVASLAARAASGLGLPAAEQERLRRPGLVYDLGKIAVPYRL